MLKFSKADIEATLKGLDNDATLMLVGDHGVYIRSSKPAPKDRVLAYAEGCNPEKDDNWYDAKGMHYGYDDGGDAFGTAGALRDLIAMSP